jgi:hypothetical protein
MVTNNTVAHASNPPFQRLLFRDLACAIRGFLLLGRRILQKKHACRRICRRRHSPSIWSGISQRIWPIGRLRKVQLPTRMPSGYLQQNLGVDAQNVFGCVPEPILPHPHRSSTSSSSPPRCRCEVPLPLPSFYMLSTHLSPLSVATRCMLRRWAWMQGREREYVKMHALLPHPGRCVPTPIRRHVRWRSHAIALKIVCLCISRRKDDGLKKMYGSFCRCHDHIPFYTHHGARNPQCNVCSTPFCNGQ